jgi:hypothetical protein
LHLRIKDVFSATKTKQNRRAVPEYPEGYPFEPLLNFVSDCKKVIKFFNNHHGPKAFLKRALKTAEKKTLVQVAPTQWGSLIGMARSLHDAEEELYHLVAS